jgi:D-alanyl-D-alanine dipeptidase
LKIWNEIPIEENKDKLITIPSCFKFFSPHPYYDLGAPYKGKKFIWKLREEVVKRLIKVNDFLKLKNDSLSLLFYDSWRPIEVQKFMFNRAFILECERLNIDASEKDMEQYSIVKKKC